LPPVNGSGTGDKLNVHGTSSALFCSRDLTTKNKSMASSSVLYSQPTATATARRPAFYPQSPLAHSNPDPNENLRYPIIQAQNQNQVPSNAVDPDLDLASAVHHTALSAPLSNCLPSNSNSNSNATPHPFPSPDPTHTYVNARPDLRPRSSNPNPYDVPGKVDLARDVHTAGLSLSNHPTSNSNANSLPLVFPHSFSSPYRTHTSTKPPPSYNSSPARPPYTYASPALVHQTQHQCRASVNVNIETKVEDEIWEGVKFGDENGLEFGGEDTDENRGSSHPLFPIVCIVC
jgi:hypothetical protein